jgi:uncharacterized MnhB-related membrane protein
VSPAEVFILVLMVCFILTSILVLLAKKLVVVISAIGLGSVFLAVIFFIFDAPFAGAFELSVGAGLISVLFIIATSVSNRAVDEID